LYNGKIKDLYSFQIIGSPYAYKLTSKEKGEHRILISILKRAKPPGIGKRLEGFKHIQLESLNNARVNAGEAAPHIVPRHLLAINRRWKPLYEKLKDINEVFRCRKLKDRQYNCQEKNNGSAPPFRKMGGSKPIKCRFAEGEGEETYVLL
jgi:hypothetical protein